MTRIIDFEDMPTRVKTSLLSTKLRKANIEDGRKISKYKTQKPRHKRDKIANHLEA